ncbi:cold shock domain-containing protein [Pseudonocardia sp. RS11V-5]|uniref:cold-shock protein n=1 Tax=Pseudonocardia terrae TaxID=2905831 RepID=UPI001E379B0E|nr:cold shock domain-containing protein [Pseudonocardia terrae]MCE3551371.1 cold shock domain-containing protein [Pseudonocardia terrae]
MATGTVQWFDPRQGSGLIVLDDGREVTVRRAQIDGGGSQSLRASDRVEFDLHESESGLAVSGVFRL